MTKKQRNTNKASASKELDTNLLFGLLVSPRPKTSEQPDIYFPGKFLLSYDMETSGIGMTLPEIIDSGQTVGGKILQTLLRSLVRDFNNSRGQYPSKESLFASMAKISNNWGLLQTLAVIQEEDLYQLTLKKFKDVEPRYF